MVTIKIIRSDLNVFFMLKCTHHFSIFILQIWHFWFDLKFQNTIKFIVTVITKNNSETTYGKVTWHNSRQGKLCGQYNTKNILNHIGKNKFLINFNKKQTIKNKKKY